MAARFLSRGLQLTTVGTEQQGAGSTKPARPNICNTMFAGQNCANLTAGIRPSPDRKSNSIAGIKRARILNPASSDKTVGHLRLLGAGVAGDFLENALCAVYTSDE